MFPSSPAWARLVNGIWNDTKAWVARWVASGWGQSSRPSDSHTANQAGVFAQGQGTWPHTMGDDSLPAGSLPSTVLQGAFLSPTHLARAAHHPHLSCVCPGFLTDHFFPEKPQLWILDGTPEGPHGWLLPPLQVPGGDWQWATWLPETPERSHDAPLSCRSPWCILATLCHTVNLS